MTLPAATEPVSELNQSVLDAFQRDGYVIVRSLFDDDQMSEIARWTDEITAFPEEPARHMVYYEPDLRAADEKVLSRIENFCPFHDRFNDLLSTGRVSSCINALFAEPPVLFKDKINYKMSGGDGFKAHQDVQAGWDRYAPIHITMMVSIDEATPANGCLELAGGLHQQGLLGGHWKPLEEDSDIGYVLCPTRVGDVVFFDSFVPHRSGRNLTESARRILYVTYNRASDGDQRKQYYADKRASYPPDIERDPEKEYVFRV